MSFDPRKGFNSAKEEAMAGQDIQPIPAGKRLFILNDLKVTGIDNSPKFKKTANDFVMYVRAEWADHETGLLLSRYDNGSTFNTRLKICRLGQINTLPALSKFMKALKAPNHAPEPNELYWKVQPNGDIIFTGHDNAEYPGPLGLPAKLEIVVKREKATIAKRDSNGNVVKITKPSGYQQTVYIPLLDDDGKQVWNDVPYILCHEAPEEFKGSFGESDMRWPILHELSDDEKIIRGDYFRESAAGGSDADGPTPEQQQLENEVSNW